ncbi:MAG: glycoside hydrolase family 43 protein, partial [Bacteroidota bacterium]
AYPCARYKKIYFLCKSISGNKPVIQLFKAAVKNAEEPELLATQNLGSDDILQLKIEAKKDSYAFYYAEKKNNWVLLKDKVDGKWLSTKIAGGFVGSLYGLYGTSIGKPTGNIARFSLFEYKGNDEVYR